MNVASGIFSILLSPITTYLELTVAEPCQTLREARRSKKIYADREKRFSLLSLLRRQKEACSVEEQSNTPLVHVASVTEHYYHGHH